MNKTKALEMLASWSRSFLAGALTAYTLDQLNWKAMLFAGLSAVLPVSLRAANPKDKAFGVTAE